MGGLNLQFERFTASKNQNLEKFDHNMSHNLKIMVIHTVVVFSIIVQGLTVAPLATRLGREPELDV